MNKLNKNVVALVVGVLLLGAGAANAYSGFSWGGVQKDTAALLAAKVPAPELVPVDSDPELGAVVDPNNLPQLLCTGDSCTQTVTASFADATTTFVSVATPFLMRTTTASDVILYNGGTGEVYTGATTTVDLVRMNITAGATSSFRLACGASANPTGSLPLLRTIASTTPALAGDSIPTSTVGVIENNVGTAQGGRYDVGSVAKIMLSPGLPYLVCIADPVNASAFTNAQNTFDGKFTVRFSKIRL